MDQQVSHDLEAHRQSQIDQRPAGRLSLSGDRVMSPICMWFGLGGCFACYYHSREEIIMSSSYKHRTHRDTDFSRD